MCSYSSKHSPPHRPTHPALVVTRLISWQASPLEFTPIIRRLKQQLIAIIAYPTSSILLHEQLFTSLDKSLPTQVPLDCRSLFGHSLACYCAEVEPAVFLIVYQVLVVLSQIDLRLYCSLVGLPMEEMVELFNGWHHLVAC